MPEISQEYYNFIHEVIQEKLKIPKGYKIPDYFFINETVIIDNSKKYKYRPFVILKFGDNYIDDRYLSVLITPEFKEYNIIEE